MKQLYRRFTIAITIVLLLTPFVDAIAQRQMEKLDRGVVAVKNNSGNFFVSWRFLATDPDDILFNLYARPIGGTFNKLNAHPLSVTNFSAPSNAIAAYTQLYVTTIIDGVESEPSGVFRVPHTGYPTTYRSAFLDINFQPAVDGLELHRYQNKFIWPADLDGDGEYDYIVDRLSVDGGTHKVQAYLSTGKLLWTIDMGPNVPISGGHNDMVIAYDMDGDGKAEVIIKSSDGTAFADGKGVFGSETLDTDNDGIINYSTQNVYNQPHYISVIDGMTGLENNSIAMKLPSIYTRSNKSIFMGTDYSSLNGHMGILYLDGKRPSVVFKYMVRTSADQRHWYFASTYGYNQSGELVNWYNWERGTAHAAEAHGIRIADVTLDGRDEMLDIGYGLKYDGTIAFNAFLSHGDRFRVGDIDPERPGLEVFAVQQNATNMLGQLIYDAATGEHIKTYYLTGIGDVGRGECMDVDSTRFGYEFWSTMPNIYDAKGNILREGSSPWPYEGVWWDGELDREQLSATDGSGFNAMIEKYNHSTKAFGNRLIEFAKMTNWQARSKNGVRPGFFGDIIGDWREEVLLEKRGSVTINGVTHETSLGFVGFSTDYPTNHRIYCLMQNPAYRMQATTKGYYQAPMTDYFLGWHMPAPPVPPVQQAKMTWALGDKFDISSSNFVQMHTQTPVTFTNGDDIMFDVSGDHTSAIQIPANIAPSKLWAMNPKGKDYVLTGPGMLTGNMELVKSMHGKFTLNGNHTYTGRTLISEGVLSVNGTLSSPVVLSARGTLMGNAVLNGGITLHPGIHIEGGRLSPGNGNVSGQLGKITINGAVTMTGKTNIEFDVMPGDPYRNDSLVINGDFTVSGVNRIIIIGDVEPGNYSLIQWTGSLVGSVDNFAIAGITGLPVQLVIDGNTLQLVVNATREATAVKWTGATDGNWDYLTSNFKTTASPALSTFFVKNDSVLFDDEAVNTDIQLNELMVTNGVQFANRTKAYTLSVSGTGGIAGSASLVKEGKGLLFMNDVKSTYTGKTTFDNALVKVNQLNQSDVPGVLGQAPQAAANWLMNDTRLIIDGINSITDRGMTISGNDTIEIARSNGVASFTGIIAGGGNLIKTGPGQINLSGTVANTYSGETIIKGGTVGLGGIVMNNSGFGSTGRITLENGARINMFNTSSYGQSPTWHLTIPTGHTATLNASSRCDIRGSISGGGTLNFNIPYVRTDLVAGGENFTGVLNVTGANPFRITTNSIGLPSAQVILTASIDMSAYASVGASSSSTTTQVRLGSVAGVATANIGNGRWIIGSDNRDAVFNGTIGTGATITKVGTGKWTLTGTSTSTNTFTVSGGRLEVRNVSGSATGSGTLSISNAMLSGTGRIGGPIIMSTNSVLMPGLTETTIGTLTAEKNVSLTVNATTIMKANSISNDRLIVGGTLFLNGTLDLRRTTGEWESGRRLTLFEAATVAGSFSKIIPETPGEGLIWDLSEVSQGVISVAFATGFQQVQLTGAHVYPSVVEDVCFVSFDNNPGIIQVVVYHLNGEKWRSFSDQDGSTTLQLDLSGLAPGVYLLRMWNDTGNYSHKLIKK